MYYSDRVSLIRKVSDSDTSGNPILDPIGNPQYTEESSEVWADVRSPSRAEVAAAGARGLTASAVVVVHASDYAGQSAIDVDGVRLTVYRTFRKGEDVELYATEKRGESGEG